MKRDFSMVVLAAMAGLAGVTAVPFLRGAGCDMPKCEESVTIWFTEVTPHPYPSEEAANDAAIVWNTVSYFDQDYNNGDGSWMVDHGELAEQRNSCEPQEPKPANGSEANNPAAITTTKPEDYGGDGGSCSSCSGSGSGSGPGGQPATWQSSVLPTAFNLDVGLGRDVAGMAYGRLRYGFDLAGNASTLRQAMSLEYAPAEGKFALEEFQPGETTVVLDAQGRPATMSNGQMELAFTWTLTGGVVTNVTLVMSPAAAVVGTGREFEPVILTLDYTPASTGTDPKITIEHVGEVSRSMSITGHAVSAQEYTWTMVRFDGATEEGTSSPLPNNERLASTVLTPADASAPVVTTVSRHKMITGDPEHTSLLKERSVTTGSGATAVTRTTIYTHHENPDASHLYLKNLLASVTYDDGTWVAYPDYDPVAKRPTVELRPWMDGPATAAAGLAAPASCRRLETQWSIRPISLLALYPAGTTPGADLTMKLPKRQTQVITESVGGKVLSVTERDMGVIMPRDWGGPFEPGGSLEAAGAVPAIVRRSTVYDGQAAEDQPYGTALRTRMELFTANEAFGNGDEAAFRASYDSGTGLLTLRRALTAETAGSYEDQTFDADMTGGWNLNSDTILPWLTIQARRSHATRHLAGTGGEAQVQEVIYSSAADTTGTVVSTTVSTQGSGVTTVTRNGGLVSTETQDTVWLNGVQMIKTTVEEADGSQQITWTDAATGEVTQEQDRQGVLKVITRSGLVTSTVYSGGGLKAQESEERDEQQRPVSVTDRNQRTTTYQYSPDGRTTTVTAPDGGTHITSLYLDGRLKSVTGTAVAAPEFHSFSVNDGTQDVPAGSRPAGSVTEEIRLGSASSARVRWITRDALGRTVAEQAPAPPQAGGGAAGAVTTLYRRDLWAWAVSPDDTTPYAEFDSVKETTVAGSGLLKKASPFPDLDGNEAWIGYEEAGGNRYREQIRTRRTVQVKAPGPSTTLHRWEEEEVAESGLGADGSATRVTLDRRQLDSAGANTARHRVAADGSVTVWRTTFTNTATVKKRVDTVETGLAAGLVAPAVISSTTYVNGRATSTLSRGVTREFAYHALGQITSVSEDGLAAISSRTYRTVGSGAGTLTTDEVASETRHGVTTTYAYDAAGRVVATTSPAGTVRYAYDAAGRVTHQWGATYPVAYEYSAVDGQLTLMKTYRQGAGFEGTLSDAVPAAFTTLPAALTIWSYDAASGALVGKTDHGGRTLTYRYDAQGRLKERRWARGAVTTYHYDVAGRLSGQTYNDATPPVTWTYNAAGQVLSVTDGAGAHGAGFGTGALASVPQGETFSAQDAGFALGLERSPGVITNAGTAAAPVWKRTQGLVVTRQPAGPFGLVTLASTAHTFLADGRLDTVLSDGVRFSYGSYLAGTARTLSVATMNGSTATPVPYSTMKKTLGTTAPDTGRVKTITYGASGAGAETTAQYRSGWTYSFDTAGRRSTVTTAATGANVRPGWSWGYNARGEVTSADRYDGSATQALETFAYDAIGNRVNAKPTPGSGATTYPTTVSDPTAYSRVQRPSEMIVSGHVAGAQLAGTEPVVTLADDTGLAQDVTATNERTTPGDAGSYRRRFAVHHAKPNVGFYALQTVTATDAANATNTSKQWVYVPPRQDVLAYDEDGNIRRDARWMYHWDGENRLVVMEERPDIPAFPAEAAASDRPPRVRLEFFYDAQHRRSAKRVYHWSATAQTWTTWAYTLFVYDNWNLIAELDLLNSGTPTRTYTWGTDLSHTMSGAGGVGGLLMVKRWQRNASSDASVRALVHSDANGNVMALYGLEAQAMLGVMDYDAFGNQVINTVAMGNDVCPMGFSSKYLDAETGHVQYQLRTYVPEWGRWLNRDRIGERGGINLFGMVGNDAVNKWDVLGLVAIKYLGAFTIYDQPALHGVVELFLTASFGGVGGRKRCVTGTDVWWWIEKHLPPDALFPMPPNLPDYFKNKGKSLSEKYDNVTPYTPEGLDAHESTHVKQLEALSQGIERELERTYGKIIETPSAAKAQVLIDSLNRKYLKPQPFRNQNWLWIMFKNAYPPKSNLGPGEAEAEQAAWDEWADQLE